MAYVDGDASSRLCMEDWFWDDMSDSPEDYLDFDDDRELTQGSSKDELEKINEELIGDT